MLSAIKGSMVARYYRMKQKVAGMNLYAIRKYLLILLGSFSLALGFFGAFIPVLPTTPFLLLASFCYLRSSEPMYNWLINHRLFGAYLYSYLTYKAISKKTKVCAVVFLWGTLLISALLVSSLHLRILLAASGVGVTVHLMTLRTLSSEEMKTLRDSYRRKPKAQT